MSLRLPGSAMGNEGAADLIQVQVRLRFFFDGMGAL